MVRLKEMKKQYIIQLPKFQFHYGTIKSKREDLSLYPLHYINSTMVRLKDNQNADCIKQAIQFQFHYGTIKSLDAKENLFGYSRFQFHYGTIKSSLVHCRLIRLRYFNSTMVRLKVSCSSAS